MATNQYNTRITQVQGSAIVIEFSGQPSHPFKVEIAGQRWVFKSQTRAREFVHSRMPVGSNE